MNHLKIFFFVLASGTFSSLQAQNSMFDLGLEGGPNLSTLIGSSDIQHDFHPKIGASGGFIFQYNFKNFLSLKTGFSYQQKGILVKNDPFGWGLNNPIGDANVKTSLDYVTFPILVKATFGEKVRFFANAGPYAGYLVGKQDYVDFAGKKLTTRGDFSDVNRWDFGAVVGVGVTIPIRTYWEISIDLRNYIGMADITRSNTSKYYTNTTDLRIGVAYKLGFYKDY